MATQTIDMSNVETCTFNNQNVGEIYLNSDKIWPTSSEYIELVISGGELDLTFDEDFGDNIETSLDLGQTWVQMYAGDNLYIGTGDRVRVRGFSNRSVGNSNHTPMWSTTIVSGNPIIDCYGRLDALLDYQTSAMNQVPQMANNTFDSLFYNWTMLRHAPEISLATSLPQYACYNLFRGCSNLINAPNLPATTLGYYCYGYMFSNCTSMLTAPPILPAQTLGSLCYESMFSGCTGLINGPSEISALSLPGGACRAMFKDCSSLISGPNILATSYTGGAATTQQSFYNMFLRCSALTKAPDLLATTIPRNACATMFAECSSLKVPPKIYATHLEQLALNNIFRDCVNLEKLPKLNFMSGVRTGAQRMFSGCSKIKISETQTGEYVNAYRIPFTGTSTADAETCYNIFYNTGGTYTGTAIINTTYYTSNEIAD